MSAVGGCQQAEREQLHRCIYIITCLQGLNKKWVCTVQNQRFPIDWLEKFQLKHHRLYLYSNSSSVLNCGWNCWTFCMWAFNFLFLHQWGDNAECSRMLIRQVNWRMSELASGRTAVDGESTENSRCCSSVWTYVKLEDVLVCMVVCLCRSLHVSHVSLRVHVSLCVHVSR